MKICGWIKSIDIDLDDLIPGDIIFYGQDRSGNNHLSFFVDSEDGLAIGMYGKKQCPILHSYEFEDLWHGKKREILARFTLENKIGGKHERHFFG
jgi:hypothetical protein